MRDMATAEAVIVDLEGKIVAADRGPSTDAPTHLGLYRAFLNSAAWRTAIHRGLRRGPKHGYGPDRGGTAGGSASDSVRSGAQPRSVLLGNESYAALENAVSLEDVT